MGLIKAGLYIGAATYIINKITDEKKNHKSNFTPQNTSYPPPQQYPDNRAYPPQYEQYSSPSHNQQQQQRAKFQYHDTNAPYENQYQAPQYSLEERGSYQGQGPVSQKSIGGVKIEDSPAPRQWADAKPAGSSKW